MYTRSTNHPIIKSWRNQISLDDDFTSKGGKNQTDNSSETCTTSTFKSVRELSQGGEMLNNSSSVDMGKALRGLVSCEPHAAPAPLTESIDKTGNIRQKSFCSEIHIPGHKFPLDLTLKTNMRLLSSSSVNWHDRTHFEVFTTSCGRNFVKYFMFVVMFTLNDGPNKTKCACHAYVSQSTRNLRSLPKENDVSFAMPLCHSKGEDVELSEIEKHNLGKFLKTRLYLLKERAL